jgi:poly(3-hydroxybutyrate) depolymerase
MEEATRIHNETMALAVLVEKAINNGEADSMNTISNDSIVHWRQLFEAWEGDVVGVPGNEAHHTHASGNHHHDHTPPDVLDDRVPYTGGVGITGVYYPPIDSVMNVWSAINACNNRAQVLVNNKDYKFTQWSNCDAAATIQYYLTQDGGHAWPGGLPGSSNGDTPSTVISANDLLWEFFQQHPMP